MTEPRRPPVPLRGGAAGPSRADQQEGGRLSPAAAPSHPHRDAGRSSDRGAPGSSGNRGAWPGEEGGIVDDPSSLDFDDLLDGKYRLLQRLDEGGMGSLYVAHNVALDVPVAVKIIRADLRGAEKRVMAERLLQEARAAAKLGHSAIVRMMDFGFAENGDPYLVMELLNGEDLATALDQRGHLSATKAVRILLPIANALAAAHEQGIVHRDLKPENIFLSQSSSGQLQPKLIDFGIAKVPRRSKKRLTLVGDALGTPDYMAPEQARGEDVDERADIWGLATILYETVSGGRPFEAPSNHALLRAIIEDDPIPLASQGVEDEQLCAIIDRGLRKKPADRWPSVRAFGEALATWLSGQGIVDDICGTSLQSAWLSDPTGHRDALVSVAPPAPKPAAVAVVVLPDVPEPPGARTPADAAPPSASSQSKPRAPNQKAAAPAVSAGPAVAKSKAKVAPESSAVPASSESRAAASARSASRKPKPGAPMIVVLWILALTGVAAAVTGFLDTPLPGIPQRLPQFWR